MKVIVLTAIILTVDLVHGNPCQSRSPGAAYRAFVRRHILQQRFDRTSKPEWERYLQRYNLCGRVRVQSFIDAASGQVLQICRGGGRQVRGAVGPASNLCISNSAMTVYDVVSTNNPNCQVTRIRPAQRNVVVACNNINNQCFPVHYQRFNGQQPGNLVCR